MNRENRDFKYVLQDVSHVYIGARYTYGEMMDADEIPFKFKAVISHYMLKEVAADTTPENHIFFLDGKELSCMVYRQLRAKFRLNIPVSLKNGLWKYKSSLFLIDEIIGNRELHEKMDKIIVEEMIISKLHIAMMSF